MRPGRGAERETPPWRRRGRRLAPGLRKSGASRRACEGRGEAEVSAGRGWGSASAGLSEALPVDPGEVAGDHHVEPIAGEDAQEGQAAGEEEADEEGDALALHDSAEGLPPIQREDGQDVEEAPPDADEKEGAIAGEAEEGEALIVEGQG